MYSIYMIIYHITNWTITLSYHNLIWYVIWLSLIPVKVNIHPFNLVIKFLWSCLVHFSNAKWQIFIFTFLNRSNVFIHVYTKYHTFLSYIKDDTNPWKDHVVKFYLVKHIMYFCLCQKNVIWYLTGTQLFILNCMVISIMSHV